VSIQILGGIIIYILPNRLKDLSSTPFPIDPICRTRKGHQTKRKGSHLVIAATQMHAKTSCCSGDGQRMDRCTQQLADQFQAVSSGLIVPSGLTLVAASAIAAARLLRVRTVMSCSAPRYRAHSSVHS